MKRLIYLVLAIVLVFGVSPVKAETPDVLTIMSKMEKAVSSWRSGTRKIKFTMRNRKNVVTHQWEARLAYKSFEDGTGALLVVLKPENIRGNAHLFWVGKDKKTKEWCYYTHIRRVKQITGLAAYDSFLGTDFSYADLGLKDPGGTHTLLGKEMHKGVMAYKVETIPKVRGHYSRIVRWIAADTYLPIQRDYYDATGRHWKTKVFENVITVDNIPKPLKVRMTDVQRRHSTEIATSEVCYDVEYITRDTFNPAKLPDAHLSPVCSVKLFPKK